MHDTGSLKSCCHDNACSGGNDATYCIIEHHFDAPLLIRFTVNQHDSMAKPCTAQLSNTADFDEAYLCLLGILHVLVRASVQHPTYKLHKSHTHMTRIIIRRTGVCK